MELSLLFIAHLFGDFVVQNRYMQGKWRSSWVCTVHVAAYSTLFWLLLPWPWVLLILSQHWMQDRFQIHLKWMRFYRQTPAEQWPTGPLCVDQTFHLLFITLTYLTWVAIS